ncbi:CDP-diacylglycerol--glycerol-3-phosphate 3-phosphatidyltransferase [Thermosipho atlanticus]|uniref:CDP-diacylglycerol--glycerol-3-phosphate 3-phosphatidyltransferase n=1 Tax=Thermosipho atlanticus DSM 15807 TaxID=1123380 RepID=A0A1M5U4J8_9BACT|nr:CDP-diacylglycerol--glycerol-3-phosphate 3-phosphatidyltransferase [Thermosipho atlanticus]SHH57884.1 CDP-diacylglycerol--glycerol-3-phosphate 3-phosphatidyltransferase [Thermosipho atlanticus DSM 15807]
MNIPNIITWIRVVLTAILVAFLIQQNYIVAFILFLIASFSDYLDGYFARKLNQVSNFGKIFDQMSDKILITSILIVFVQQNLIPSWILVVIVFRDTLVTTIRMAAVNLGTVVAANYFGKLKTVSQIVWVISLFLQVLYFKNLESFNNVIGYLVVIVTILSGLIYMVQNREVLKG